MQNKTYIIEFGVYFDADRYQSGKMKVKNCMSSLHAKVKLEDFLKRKHTGFKSLVVYNCNENIFDGFNFIFQNKN